MPSPQIDTTTATELLTLAQEKALSVSQGRLSDTSPASPVTAILEATSVVASTVQAQINNLATTIENNRVAVFGITRGEGQKASVLVEARLQALYAESFILPRGYRFGANGQTFETTADLTIPAFVDSGRVVAIALNPGSDGNVPLDSSVAFPAVNRLQGIYLMEAGKGGTNAETDEEWKNRIYATIRRRDTLISEDDFAQEVIGTLGTGSIAIAIGRLKPDKVTLQNGYVSVFGLNPDGSALTTSQISTLQDAAAAKAAMASVTVWSVEVFPINVGVIVGLVGGASPDAIASLINQVVRDYLQPGKLQPGALIMNKAVEYLVQGIVGVQLGAVSVELNGLAQPQALPNKWTVGKPGIVKVTTTSGTGSGNEYEFTS